MSSQNLTELALQAEVSPDPFAWLYLNGCYLIGRNESFQIRYPTAARGLGSPPGSAWPPPVLLRKDAAAIEQLRANISQISEALKSSVPDDDRRLVCICERVRAMISIAQEDCVFEAALTDLGATYRVHEGFYFLQTGEDWPKPFSNRHFGVERTHTRRVFDVGETAPPTMSSRLLDMPGLGISVQNHGERSDIKPHSLTANVYAGGRLLRSWKKVPVGNNAIPDYDAADELLRSIAGNVQRLANWDCRVGEEQLQKALESVGSNSSYYAQFRSLLEGLRANLGEISRDTFLIRLASIRSRLWDSPVFGREAHAWLKDWIGNSSKFEEAVEKANITPKMRRTLYRNSQPESAISVGEFFWPSRLTIESMHDRFAKVSILGYRNGRAFQFDLRKLTSALGYTPVTGESFLAEVNINVKDKSLLRFRNVKPAKGALVGHSAARRT